MLIVYIRRPSLMVGLFFFAGSLSSIPPAVAREGGPDETVQQQIQEVKTETWKLGKAAEAKVHALRSVGLKSDIASSAKLVTIETDSTPFLSDELKEREVWMVTVPGWSIELKSAPAHVKDTYRRTLDIYVDPVTGNLLKLKTRWPENVRQDRTEPNAKSAEIAIFPEKYHGFPAEPAPISFVEALEASGPWAAMALDAKQIAGFWVLWSAKGTEPRPMWVITLCGTSGLPAFHADTSNEDLRIVVDPVKKEWVVASDSPYCVPVKDKGRSEADEK